jgi:hypothetical protein
MNIHINKNKKITGPSIIKVIIFDLVRFLLKKNKQTKIFLKKQKPVLVRFDFFKKTGFI